MGSNNRQQQNRTRRYLTLTPAEHKFLLVYREARRVNEGALALPLGSAERAVANRSLVTLLTETMLHLDLPRALKENMFKATGSAVVPEDDAERARWFQGASHSVATDLGVLAPSILMTLAGSLNALDDGRQSGLLRPRKLGPGEAGGTTQGDVWLRRWIALRLMLEAALANQDLPDWVEDWRIGRTFDGETAERGFSGRTCQRWVKDHVSPADRDLIRSIVGRTHMQEKLTDEEQEFHDWLTQHSLEDMLKGSREVDL